MTAPCAVDRRALRGAELGTFELDPEAGRIRLDAGAWQIFGVAAHDAAMPWAAFLERVGARLPACFSPLVAQDQRMRRLIVSLGARPPLHSARQVLLRGGRPDPASPWIAGVVADHTTQQEALATLESVNGVLQDAVSGRSEAVAALARRLTDEVLAGRQLADRLQRAEDSLEVMARAASIASWAIDHQTGEVLLSPSLATLLGEPAPTEAVPHDRLLPLFQVIDEDTSVMQDFLRVAIAERRAARAVVRQSTGGGPQRIVLLKAEPVLDATGRTTHSIGVWQDLTRAARFAALRSGGRNEPEAAEGRSTQPTQNALRLLLDALPVHLSVLDAEGRVILVNEEFARFHGATTQEIEARGSVGVWQPPQGERWHADRAAACDGQTVRRPEVAVLSRSGGIRYFDTRLQPFRPSPTSPPCVLALAQDVTTRVYAQARQADQERLMASTLLAARVAHAVNNPLGGIKAAFFLLRDAVPAEHPHYHYFARIDRELDRVSRVIHQMIESYQPVDPSLGDADFAQGIQDVVARVAPRFATAAVALEVEELPRCRVAMSPSRLRLVAFNLIENALEAAPKDSAVRVLAHLTPHDVHLEVIDRGRGIPRELQESVFDPFYSTKDMEGGGGLGLGLPTARQAVEAAGGSLHCSSARGGPTAFLASIPIRVVDAPPLETNADDQND